MFLSYHHGKLHTENQKVLQSKNHSTEFFWPKGHLTETPFDRTKFNRMPFSRKFIRGFAVQPNAVWLKVHFTKRSYYRFFFQKMVIWPNLLSTSIWSNELSVKWHFGQITIFKKKLSVIWTCGQMTFRSNDLSVKRLFDQMTIFRKNLSVICHFVHLTRFSN
jgi:hypothetical protein